MDKRVPEVRFKGFTDDWEQHSLNDMAKSFMYGLNASSIPYDGVNKYLRITDIDDNSHKLIIDNLMSPNVKLEDSQDYLLKQGDILFARTGASVGKTYLYKKSDGIVFFAGFLIRMRTKEVYNEQFVFQNTLTEKYNNFVQITSQRSGQPGINAKEYSQFHLYAPTEMNEQNKVGSITEKLDLLIGLYQKKLNLYESLKKYLLQNLFPSDGEKIPNVRFADFSGDWEQHKFSELYEKTTEKNDLSFSSSKIISVANMYYKSEQSINSTDKYMKTYNVFREGDIAYEGHKNKNFSYGRFVENDIGNGIVSHVFDVFRPKENYDLYFWKYLINNENIMGNILRRVTTKATMMNNLVSRDFLKQKIRTSNYTEQKKVGTFLKKLDDLINIQRDRLAFLEEIKRYYLQKLFI
ncbi:restriction endonuclease subunit S [Companilactobacillus zhachilii]|uniref:Restriction endonuclease subunit S n=1 Tax=Companilactobacillus zhachilii TaxID=2304606 RepID=A0A386PXL2_9LACO|nr:restriction endonuclease subunit S [Companilactobacillus zhachilii]AYE39227.1 restriction endonuclease subunit S [Companilactobacillus zhachilii]